MHRTIPRDQLSTRRDIGTSGIETAGERTTAGHGRAAGPSGSLADVVKIGTHVLQGSLLCTHCDSGYNGPIRVSGQRPSEVWDGQNRPPERSRLEGTPFEGPLHVERYFARQRRRRWTAIIIVNVIIISLSLMMMSTRRGLFAEPSLPSRGLGIEKALLVRLLRHRAKMREGCQRAKHRDHCPVLPTKSENIAPRQ